jgi:predicted glutamine amidotransferase
MCKLLILTSHESTKLDSIIVNAWSVMSSTERDGFGAAWVTPSGRIGWVRSSVPFIRESLPEFIAGFGARHGETSDGGALIIHGRTATCGVSLCNTHPMLSGRTALVHNGVVSSVVFDNKTTSCDSELLLTAFNHGDMHAVTQGITGYYAFGHIKAERGGRSVLTVVRDNRANLCVGRYGSGWAFATTSAQLVAAGAVESGEFKQCFAARFCGDKFLGGESFVPAVAPVALASKASKAFGGKSVPVSDEAYDDWVNPELRLNSTNWRAYAK